MPITSKTETTAAAMAAAVLFISCGGGVGGGGVDHWRTFKGRTTRPTDRCHRGCKKGAVNAFFS